MATSKTRYVDAACTECSISNCGPMATLLRNTRDGSVITASDISSGTALNNDVLTADGSGNATWRPGAGASIPRFGEVYALMPGDNAATIAGGTHAVSATLRATFLSAP